MTASDGVERHEEAVYIQHGGRTVEVHGGIVSGQNRYDQITEEGGGSIVYDPQVFGGIRVSLWRIISLGHTIHLRDLEPFRTRGQEKPSLG